MENQKKTVEKEKIICMLYLCTEEIMPHDYKKLLADQEAIITAPRIGILYK